MKREKRMQRPSLKGLYCKTRCKSIEVKLKLDQEMQNGHGVILLIESVSATFSRSFHFTPQLHGWERCNSLEMACQERNDLARLSRYLILHSHFYFSDQGHIYDSLWWATLGVGRARNTICQISKNMHEIDKMLALR